MGSNEKSTSQDEEKSPPSTSSVVTSTDDDDELGECGWLGWNPRILRCCNGPKGFLFLYCCIVIVQGMLVNGFVNVSISTLEKRFGFLSSETGVISTGYDMAFCVLTLFVSYFGAESHRPRAVGIGVFIMGVGALIFTLPHFTTPSYSYPTDFSDTCDPNNEPSCEGVDSNLHNYFWVFLLGQLLHGVGCTPLYTLGLAFIEDSVSKESTSLYLGIGNAASIFGPILGYGLGGVVLGIYVDFDTVDMDTIGIDPSDPRWVGAWWLGVIISMGLAFLLVLPTLAFPREFSGTSTYRKQKNDEIYQNQEGETARENFGKSYKDFPVALLTLAKNPTYMFVSAAACSEAMVISGFTTFLPKIIENEFQLTAGTAAILAGVISIPGGIVGHVLAGYIVKRFNFSTSRILLFNMFYCFIVCAFSPILLTHCTNKPVAGVNVPYANSEIEGLLNECNIDCACQEEFYIPVCGADGLNYFTACHAGCTEGVEVNETLYFENCGCIANTTADGYSAYLGTCPEECNTIGLFLGIFFIVVMFTFMSNTPALVVTFRVVPHNMRSFALGVQWLVIRALGSIPGPIMFGSLLDLTCILWQVKECDGSQGNCWIYDAEQMAYNLIYVSIACKVFSIIFFGLARHFHKPGPTTSFEIDAKTEKVPEINEAYTEDETDNAKIMNDNDLTTEL